PSTSSTTITTVAIGTGRRITVVAARCQNPSPTGGRGRRLTDSASMRGPSRTRIAGSTTTAPTAASATTGIPAYAKERRNTNGKTSSAQVDAATVIALNTTVR